MKNIWHVEDDQEMLNAMDLMLSMLGFKTCAFLNAPDAVERLLTGEKPDVLLLDINMPEISGLDMLEFIRNKKEWDQLPVVILSTEADEVTIDEAFKLGANGYLTKPVMIDELKNEIQQVIANKKG